MASDPCGHSVGKNVAKHEAREKSEEVTVKEHKTLETRDIGG